MYFILMKYINQHLWCHYNINNNIKEYVEKSEQNSNLIEQILWIIVIR